MNLEVIYTYFVMSLSTVPVQIVIVGNKSFSRKNSLSLKLVKLYKYRRIVQ
jgi:hypothetical protein